MSLRLKIFGLLRVDDTLAPTQLVWNAGDEILTIDGTPWDFSVIPNGGRAWPEGEDHVFHEPIRRDMDGDLSVVVRVVLPEDADGDQPDTDEFTVIDSVSNGPIELPYLRLPETPPEEVETFTDVEMLDSAVEELAGGEPVVFDPEEVFTDFVDPSEDLDPADDDTAGELEESE
jgi:hypothetical protein